MPSLVINGSTFVGLPEGFSSGSLAQGAYYSTDKLGAPPYVGRPIYEETDVTFDGVDGVGRIRRGFRSRGISATLIWAGSLNYCHTSRDTFFANASQLARYSIALPSGNTYQGCKPSGNWMSQSWLNMDGKCLTICNVEFEQLSATN